MSGLVYVVGAHYLSKHKAQVKKVLAWILALLFAFIISWLPQGMGGALINICFMYLCFMLGTIFNNTTAGKYLLICMALNAAHAYILIKNW